VRRLPQRWTQNGPKSALLCAAGVLLDHSKILAKLPKATVDSNRPKWKLPNGSRTKLKTVKVVSNLRKSIKNKIHRAREIFLLLNALGQNGSK
jgi:hypothetical protein